LVFPCSAAAAGKRKGNTKQRVERALLTKNKDKKGKGIKKV
jgi:hypothetical protein